MDEAFVTDRRIDKARLKALSERSDAKGLRQLAGHALALGTSGTLVLVSAGGLWLLPALVLHGVILVFLFAPLHETVHRTAFASRRLNDALAWLCGTALILPPEYFRSFHFAHHRHTQDPAKDPELAAPKPASLSAYLILLSGLPFWFERVTTTLRHATGRVQAPFLAPRQHPAIIREARLLLAFWAAVAVGSAATGSPAAVLLWLLPVLIGQPFLRAYLLAEHGGCPLVPDMLENSRTTRSTALVRWLAWNMPYHAEHHAYPGIPFHGLPAAEALIGERVAITAPGYLAVHRELLAGFGRRSAAKRGN